MLSNLVVTGNMDFGSAATLLDSVHQDTGTLTGSSVTRFAKAVGQIAASDPMTVAVSDVSTLSSQINDVSSMTGTLDGGVDDVASIAVGLSTGDTYTDSAVNNAVDTAVNTAITSVNLQLKQIATSYNDVQTEAAEARALANQLKADLNLAITMLLEMKAKMDTMNA
jgi:hypothetical protein